MNVEMDGRFKFCANVDQTRSDRRLEGRGGSGVCVRCGSCGGSGVLSSYFMVTDKI